MQEGQVFQLSPLTTRNPMFKSCFFVVTEVKSWGAQGYVQALGEKGEPGGQAYYRAQHDELVPLEPNNVAPWIVR